MTGPPPESSDRLYVFNGGFVAPRLRRILALSGWRVTLGRPGAADHIGVWGKSPTAHRGEAIAAKTAVPVLRVEDAFLRSLHPGRAKEPPLGLLIDRRGVHFDSATPSDLEHLLATHPLDDTALLDRARAAITAMQQAHLSKYSATRLDLSPPNPGYVLVIDQTKGDASIKHGAGSAALFAEMLAFARIENPGARIVIKTHPETTAGFRAGHFSAADLDGKTEIFDTPISPWVLLDGAIGVYTVTSQMGFEAILAGHRPRVFGQPFYGGWGLTQDENPVPRRERRLTRAQLFAGAMILYPTWYDPYRDRLCKLEEVITALTAMSRAWREDRRGYVASGIRLWKRGIFQKFYGAATPLRFEDDAVKASQLASETDRPLMVWASRKTDAHRAPHTMRVEDGFLRSRGLGAALTPPLSLVTDDLGIYYDPTRPSRLESLVAASVDLPLAELRRAERVIAAIRAQNVTKYNQGSGNLPDMPLGHRILVPGQVEDDASIRLGTSEITTNAALLAAVRQANPDAVVIYKPHPDVEAGLRPGALSDTADADMVLDRTDPAAILGAVDQVWTMTSLLGFEALLRGRAVTCLGTPFYAGWGLTEDRGRVPARRAARPPLAALTHAVLIGYPRYRDPKTGLPCPVEVVLDRLAQGDLPRPGPVNRVLSKLQGLLASQAHLWR